MLHPRFNGRTSAKSGHVHPISQAGSAFGQKIGAPTPQVFSQRVSVERNRQVIDRYRSSRIGAVSSHAIDSGKNADSRSSATGTLYGSATRAGKAQRHQSASVRQSLARQRPFHEPPGRSYNPYA